MIGSLVRFSTEKRQLYFPTCNTYGFFDGEVGLVISYSKTSRGDEHVRVRWLKPVLQTSGKRAEISDFDLLNFDIVSTAS